MLVCFVSRRASCLSKRSQQLTVKLRAKEIDAKSIDLCVSRSGTTLGSYRIGLFQSCLREICFAHRFSSTNVSLTNPPTLPRRFSHSGPLAIVALIFQIISCLLCFSTSCCCQPAEPSIKCFSVPLFIFVAFLFQYCSLIEASYGILLTGVSAQLFQASLVILVVNVMITAIAVDRIFQTKNIQSV